MNRSTIIVGAGIAGLTLAERLTASCENSHITVVERNSTPGGLARTFKRDGYLFDIGPHRFHTSDTIVEKYLLDILGDEHIAIKRESSVYIEGNYKHWPLTLGAVIGLPFPVLFRSCLDLFRRSEDDSIHNFAEFIIAKYGKNLYDFFFSGYTRKFTGIDSDRLHPDWAAAGVNRAVIDKKVKADNLSSLLKGLLLPKPVATTFYYPSRGGIQTFCDRQVTKIRENGGEVRFNSTASGIVTSEGRVTGVELSNGEVISVDKVFWSAPISILYPESGFRFMNTLICNIALSKRQPNTYQWCYFGQEDVIFSRLSVPRNFRENTVPEGYDSLIAEITVSRDSELWRNPDSCRDTLVSDLEKVHALNPEDIIFLDWQRIPETYPLYDLEYRKRLSSIELPEGLELLGRCGSFWYNNMDHSIAQALAIAGGEPFEKDFWKN
ncbi:MAG: FAD-dependent oxidoreductase [Candidatus Aegiribacteria sp.]|nr:FAD-dependent oxidoreductase [Candidatus Aegiribacteria sp.]